MTSLRTRIALFYAALIVVVIALGAVAIDFALRSVLIDQTRLNLAQTAEDFKNNAVEATTFGFSGEGPLTLVLSNRATLDHWAAGHQYIQIDNLGGQVLGKSSNLGGFTMPTWSPNGKDRAYEEVRLAGVQPGTCLLLDRVLFDSAQRPILIIHVGERLDIVDQLLARARTILLGVTAAALAMILLASYFIAKSAIDPIERLTAAIAEIGSERLDRRLRWTRHDELGRLANAFDAMLDRLQSAFARERQFISDASHELRTPLTIINANAQMLQRWGDRDPELSRASLEAIAEESGRLAGMVSGMLTLAKAEAGDAIPKEPLVLERLVDDVVDQPLEDQRFFRDRVAGLGLREREHPGNHPGEPAALFRDRLQRGARELRIAVAPALQHLRVRVDDRERRAQFVRGVADELAFASRPSSSWRVQRSRRSSRSEPISAIAAVSRSIGSIADFAMKYEASKIMASAAAVTP